MDTEQFLARVIPPGNYIAVAYNPHPETPGGAFPHKFFPGGAYAQAAGLMKWAASKNMDAYHAVASFTMATPDGVDGRGNTRYRGSRTQANAQALRCFWIDMDIKRAGDKKSAANTYVDRLAAMTWLGGFQAAIGMPRPNLVVNSGYGVHVYWVLEDAMQASDWLPYGSALKAALVANGYTGDSGLSGDSARILRPPGTMNMKSGQPVPVMVYDKLSRGDYPNSLVLDALKPFLGAVAPVGPGATVSALSGGVPSAALASAGAANMNAAAVANMPAPARVHEFARIATKCAQVAASIATNGAGDNRPLWYLGHLSLAHFCTDGAAYAHEIGKGDPRYTQAGTDTAVAQIAADQARKGHGPPTCNHYEINGHKGLCSQCPFHGKIKTPLVLGVDQNDLPNGYQRGRTSLERWVGDKTGGSWQRLIPGDVFNPVLDVRPAGGYTLMFTYEHAGKTYPIRVDEPDLPIEAAGLRRYFSPQSIILPRQTAQDFGDFILSWLQQLREQRLERADHLIPFGWARTGNGAHAGLAVGGTLYRPDGSEEAVPGGDPEILAAYAPRGTMAAWRTACAFVTQGRPDLQIIVAASFAAPLVKLTGHKGVALSAWSRDSGVGKSSALRVGQAIWSSTSMMSNMKDTSNAIRARIAAGRVMPHNWDEVRTSKDNVESLVSLLFEMAQGRDKARMNADSSLRRVGEWDTLLAMCGNAPLMDHVVAQQASSDAGAQRLFEMHLTAPPAPNTASAQKTISAVEENHGHAGRVYAKWLAMNYDAASAHVLKVAETLNTALPAAQAERFHVALMATVLSGATFANRLGLAVFDVKAMYNLLKTTFHDLQVSRKSTLIVDAGVLDLEQVLSSFVLDHASMRLITDVFATKGPGKVNVLVAPQFSRVDVHVAHRDKIMRVNAQLFRSWCYKHGYPAGEVIKAMETRWGLTQGRRSIAAGTPYAAGQLAVMDINLTAPELGDHLYSGNLHTVPQGRPAGALAGNQPKV